MPSSGAPTSVKTVERRVSYKTDISGKKIELTLGMLGAGITLPSKDAQVFNIRKVYADAGLDFSQTAYVECHGTGTQAGDFTELAAVSETLSRERSSDDPILVGSVKPNLGHLEGAAGVAGLIKSVLVLENAQIPPNANFENGNPNVKFHDWGLKVYLLAML